MSSSAIQKMLNEIEELLASAEDLKSKRGQVQKCSARHLIRCLFLFSTVLACVEYDWLGDLVGCQIAGSL